MRSHLKEKREKIFISVVIPVYNGELTIETLVTQLMKELEDKYRFEIILVNDCSVDDSENICIDLYNKYKNTIKFYSLAKNVGEHNSLMAGLNNCNGDYVITMDDDLQNPVSEVTKLITYISNNNYDVVYSFFKKKKHSLFRNIGSRFNDIVANIMLKKPKDLYLSSFRVMNKFIVREIIKYDLPFPYIDGLILRTTSKIGKVRVEHIERKQGRSGYTIIKLLSLWLNMFTNFSILPLRISVYLGFVFSLFGLLLGIETIIEKISNPNLPAGYAAIIVAVAIFSGIQLISLGMIGEYLGRVFLSQNKKPQYTIKTSYTNKNA